MFWRHQDRGVSDIVGTSILLAVTVVVVAAATVSLYSGTRPQGAPATLDVRAAPASASGVTLTHAGGGAMGKDDLTAIVSTTSWSERIPLGNGSFDLGNTTTLALANHTLQPGDHVEVQIVSHARNAVISSTVFDVQTNSTVGPLAGFTVAITTPDPTVTLSVSPGASVLLVAHVAHPAGRTAVYSVTANLLAIGGSGTTYLYDDGTHGDAVAGDMNYGAFVDIPTSAPQGSASITVSATDTSGALATTGTALTLNVLASVQNILNNVTTVQFLQNVTNLTNLTNNLGNVNSLFSNQTITNLGNSTVQQFLNNSNVITSLNNQTVDNFLNNTTAIGILSNSTILNNLTNLPLFGPPEISGFTPPNGSATTFVTITGKNLSLATSVSMIDANGSTWGTQWWAVDSGTIALFPSASAPVGLYQFRVTNPSGTATSASNFSLEATLGRAPTSVDVSPRQGYVSDTFNVTGTNLDTVTRLTLQNVTANVTLDTTWWQEGANLRFVMPSSAAISGMSYPNYTVNLVGTSGVAVRALHTVMLLPQPAPTITGFSPGSGTPFTEITVNGTNFVNVQSVTFNGTNVYFTVSSPTKLVAVTHNGISPGYYSIAVTTITGSNATGPWTMDANGNKSGYNGLFHALHAPIQPVYPPNVFDYFAVWAQHNTTCSPGDCANIYVKFRLAANVTLDGASGLKLVNASSCSSAAGADASGFCGFFTYNPFKPGNIPPQGFGVAKCNSGNTWVFQYNASLPNYISSTYTLSFYNTFSFSSTGNATKQDTVHTVSITTTDPSQYFNLAPTDGEIVVYDHGQPTNGNFQNCG